MNILNAKEYIERFLQIKTKDNDLKLLKLNSPQLKLYDAIKQQHKAGKPIRIIILKARQMGFSTLTEALIFHRTVVSKNTNSLIVTHKDDATNNLFNMSKLYYEMLPERLQPMQKASNSREIIFANPSNNNREKSRNPGLRSKIKCATAGGDGIGRSDTLHNVHVSEYAFWPGDKKITLSGIMQSVPNTPATMVIIESTANGYDDFEIMWSLAVKGENDFVPLFFAWHEMEDYKMNYDGFDLTDEEEEIKSIYHLSNEQLAWRRWCIKNNCSGDVNQFKQEYPACPDEAFLSTGSPVFDNDILINRKQVAAKVPYKRGRFETIKGSTTFIEDKNGYWKIYAMPLRGKHYVIGADVAEGAQITSEKLDSSCCHILDNHTLQQVAVYESHVDPDTYSDELYKVGMFYNKALVCVEINMESGVIRNLERLHYPKLYLRQRQDDITHKVEMKAGWRTTSINRRQIISDLIEYVREHSHLINCTDTIDQMIKFIRNEKGRPEGQSGSHDDLVMAYAISLQAALSGQQSKASLSAQIDYDKLEKMPRDYQEDFWNMKANQRLDFAKKHLLLK